MSLISPTFGHKIDFLSSDMMHGEGNLLAHLMILGYKVTYTQVSNLTSEFSYFIFDLLLLFGEHISGILFNEFSDFIFYLFLFAWGHAYAFFMEALVGFCNANFCPYDLSDIKETNTQGSKHDLTFLILSFIDAESLS